MDSDWNGSLKEINGINLTNYYPHRRSYNSVVFVHKKFLEERKANEEKKDKIKPKKEKNTKIDKSQQINCDKYSEISKDKLFKLSCNNDNSILEQTIRFAKNIVPLVIPPNEDRSNVFYTIKSTKKHRKKDKKPRESISEHNSHHERADPIRESKKVETYRKVRKESFSVRESVSHSSSNTLDDLNINQSLCCTFSEVSEKKYHKKEKNHSKRQSHGHKVAVSESFEAVATENAAGDARIKIHLMNDKEKHFLSDSIKEPILNAIKDCLSELNNNNLNTEIATVQKFVKSNSQKLDNILDKLTCIENKLDAHERKLEDHEKRIYTYERNSSVQEKKLEVQEKKASPKMETKTVPLPKVQDCKPKAKASTLEEIGADLIEIKEEDYSSEEELHHELLDRRSKSSIILEMEAESKEDKKLKHLGGGEVARTTKASASVGAKAERPNRLPARFCWTDAAKMN